MKFIVLVQYILALVNFIQRSTSYAHDYFTRQLIKKAQCSLQRTDTRKHNYVHVQVQRIIMRFVICYVHKKLSAL